MDKHTIETLIRAGLKVLGREILELSVTTDYIDTEDNPDDPQYKRCLRVELAIVDE